jgi:hypothetical protein
VALTHTTQAAFFFLLFVLFFNRQTTHAPPRLPMTMADRRSRRGSRRRA